MDDLDAALDRAIAATPIAPVAAFALCTDDCLMSVFASFAPPAWFAAASSDEQMLPSEWPGEEMTAFAAASDLLRARYDRATDFSAHVDDAFARLVAALARARLPPGVVRLVVSTDPGPRLLALSAAAALALDDASVTARFRAAYGLA